MSTGSCLQLMSHEILPLKQIKKSGWGGSLPLGVLVKNTGNELMSGICFQIIQGWRSWGEGLDL